MAGNAVFQVYVPPNCYNQFKDLCNQLGWTHGRLLGTLVEKCPKVDTRADTPPLHINRASSPHMLKAHIDSVTNSTITHLCQNRNWSHRDMIIYLLDNYINNVLNKEANHG